MDPKEKKAEPNLLLKSQLISLRLLLQWVRDNENDSKQDYNLRFVFFLGSSSNNSTPSTSTRRKKSRWGDEQKVIIPGIPTTLPKVSKDIADKYLCKYI
jgi:hypothetical protein